MVRSGSILERFSALLRILAFFLAFFGGFRVGLARFGAFRRALVGLWCILLGFGVFFFCKVWLVFGGRGGVRAL